jgi:hypothetical protein
MVKQILSMQGTEDSILSSKTTSKQKIYAVKYTVLTKSTLFHSNVLSLQIHLSFPHRLNQNSFQSTNCITDKYIMHLFQALSFRYHIFIVPFIYLDIFTNTNSPHFL